MASEKLIKAIADFEDENSQLTLGERIDNLRTALLWNSFNSLKKGEEHEKTDIMKHFADMERMYANQIKLNKLSGKSNEKMNDDFMKSIREMKSSIGSIVMNLNEEKEDK